MERLRTRFLNVPVDAVLHPASVSAQQVAIAQKDRARVALGRPSATSSANESQGPPVLVPARPVPDRFISKFRVVIVIGSLVVGIVGVGVWIYVPQVRDTPELTSSAGRPPEGPVLSRATPTAPPELSSRDLLSQYGNSIGLVSVNMKDDQGLTEK
jgi:hypothetical protein